MAPPHIEQSRPTGPPIEVPTFDDLPHVVDARKTGKMRYSLARALAMCGPGAKASGLEAETSDELGKRMGRYTRGIFIPWDLPLPRASYSLTTDTGAGAIPSIMPDTLFDALRNKMVAARMGARIGDWSGDYPGKVVLPVKSAASTISWPTEGNPATGSNMSIQQVQGEAHLATAFTDVSRLMLKEGQPNFRQFIVDDLVGTAAVALDQAAIAGTGSNGMPMGLAGFPWPSFDFASGTPTYKGLTTMMRTVGASNADAAPDARMGWLTSNAGREALQQTDMGGATVTGRYAWKSHCTRHPITGELEAVESVLGQPAAATEQVPSGLSGAGLSNATAVLYGNFRHLLIQVFGALEVISDPFSFASQGLVRFNIFQACDVLHLYPGLSFTSAVIVAPNP